MGHRREGKRVKEVNKAGLKFTIRGPGGAIVALGPSIGDARAATTKNTEGEGAGVPCRSIRQ